MGTRKILVDGYPGNIWCTGTKDGFIFGYIAELFMGTQFGVCVCVYTW